MAPTVYMSEVADRPYPLEDRLGYIERRRSVSVRRKVSGYRRSQSPLHCHKAEPQMGLVVEDCQQCTKGDGPLQGSLLHITLRTLVLLRRNRQLQEKLSLLQAETHAFVESVLSTSTQASTPPPNH